VTTYSFSPTNTNFNQTWDSASIWSPAAVPNGSSAVVLLPRITNTATGSQVIYEVQIQSGESYTVSVVDAASDTIYSQGSLTVLHEATVGVGSGLYSYWGTPTYSFGSLENDGGISTPGQISVAGTTVNRGSIDESVTLTTGRFENIGSLFGYQGPLTIAFSAGGAGFANLSGGTLTGGTYEVSAGATIDINVAGPITTLAANYQYSTGGALQTYDAGSTAYVSLQSSLTTIAPSGLLGIAGNYANTNALTVQGQIDVGGGSFTAPSLTIAAGGSVTGSSFGSTATLTATGGIVDNGSIAAKIDTESVNIGGYENSTLLVASAVTGSGMLVVGPGQTYFTGFKTATATVTLELAAADTASVLFADATGTLQLDAPKSFSGTIESFATGNSIVLSGISLSSVAAQSYSGDSTHGVLTLVTSGGTIALDFEGNYTSSNFSLAAGPQPLSSSPPSIVITDTAGTTSPNWNAAAAIAAHQAGTLAAHSVVADTAASIAAHIDGLQTLVAAGDLSAVVVTDLDGPQQPINPPAMTVTAAQFLGDSGVFAAIDSAYTVSVTGATAAQAEAIAGGSRVAAVTISDSVADIASQIDRLGTLAATGQVTGIAATDTAFATISVSSAQFDADHTAFDVMSGYFTITVSAGAANASIEGVTGHGVTVAFSGTASDYSLAAQGDGIGLSVTDTGTGRASVDSLRGITAVKFSDFTDIVAQTPGSGQAGSVTTGNVTELYGAVFGRLPDVPGLAYYQAEAAANPNLPLTQFAQQFLASPEYINNPAHNYAQSTQGDSQFITDCYQNLLRRAPESGAIPYYLNIIDTFTANLAPGTAAYAAAQSLGHAYVLTDFSASAEFLADVQVTAQNPSSAQHWLVLV